jgi:SAM-dependent methyltransferase
VNTLGPHQRVLDVGTGTGRLCVPLAKAGHTVVGVDFSPVMLGMAQQLTAEAGVAEQCRFYQGDLVTAIPEELAAHPAFDVVASLGVFDYISDPRGMLMHMRQFAPKRIIATFPKAGTLRCHVRQWRYKLQGLDCPLFFYTVGQLEAIGQELGASRTHIQPMGELHFAVFAFDA